MAKSLDNCKNLCFSGLKRRPLTLAINTLLLPELQSQFSKLQAYNYVVDQHSVINVVVFSLLMLEAQILAN